MNLTNIKQCFYLSIIALLFCAPAFYNGFPILFSDTSGYIWAGFTNKMQGSRSWMYSGFIRHVSLWETLWLVIFVQGLLTAGVIYLMFKEFYKGKHKSKLFIIYSAIIGSTTAVSFHVSRLMPDVFTPLMFLLFILLLLEKNLNRKERIMAIFLFFITSAMHNAHLIMNVGIILVLVCGALFKEMRMKYARAGITRKKITYLTLCIICTHLFTCTLHYSKGNKFVATKGGAIFLFARLCDFGIAQAYLKERCGGDLHGGICEHSSELSYAINFLWHKNSYLSENGGFIEKNEIYFEDLTKKILKTPKYFKAYIIRSIEATFMQFFTFGYSPVEPDIQWVTGRIKDYYPSYLLAAYSSKQVRNNYNRNDVDVNNLTQRVVLFISALLVLLLFWDPNVSEKQKILTLLIVFYLLINAFLTAATSGVFDRYQSRVVWLITLPAFWFVCNKISQNKLLNKKD
jgi:hypothetical protein